jgi:transcriptional regulator with PAS, ATPase and Fis domain
MVIADLLQSTTFVKTLLDSLPCGFLLLDKAGRVRLVNNILDRILKVNKKTAIGKGAGNTLGCLHANAHPMGCGFGECCNYCEVQKLTFNSISTNHKQRTRAELNIVIDGQVRDLASLISASPFTHYGEAFCLLIIEDPGALKAFAPTDTRDGFRGIVGQSDNLRELFDTIRQVAAIIICYKVHSLLPIVPLTVSYCPITNVECKNENSRNLL